ncbi:MAG: HEAT repeat domain-containing protein [Desulfovibrio fairfieldensis]|nr:HEAT repeat domain-containing protein [Desulfovibrio fairfieldensis]
MEEIAAGGASHVGPLFSFLLLGPQTMHRAAVALGLTTARLVEREPEAARNIIRRFMWHMNEESGNIGWGIPEAFGESLAASPLLAKDFHRVLASYLIDLGRDDNYCDNDLLRRSCYWAVGRLAQARPELCAGARPWLRKGLEDNDVICRGMAAWALAQLPPDFMDTPALRRLADAGHEEICELFDGEQLYEKSVSQLAREALAHEVPAAADPDRP